MQEIEIKTVKTGSAADRFPPPIKAPFIQSYIRSAKKGKGYVGLEFEFYFQATNLIPAGGSVVLTFPSEFSLEGSFP